MVLISIVMIGAKYAGMMFGRHSDDVESYLGDEDYDQAFLYYQLAEICQDEEERIQHLKDCIALDENYFDAKAQLGVSYRRQGDLDEARAILESAYAESAYDMYSEGTNVQILM